MHLIEFVATEHVVGEMEMDYETTLDEAEAKEWAVKQIAASYPEYDNIAITSVKEI